MKQLFGIVQVLLLAVLLGTQASAQCSRTDARGKQLCQFMHALFRGDANSRANMSQDWNVANSRYLEGTHAGIDFAVGGQANIPFYAVAGGTVVYKSNGWGDDDENSSVVAILVTNTQSGVPEIHKYGHGSSLQVGAGQQVYAGQQLGITDMVGNADGRHVHYEVSVARYLFNNQWYDLTVNDALNYKSLGSRKDVIKSLMHLTVTSKTVDPVQRVFGLRAQGSGFWVRGIPDYKEVAQGQIATFDLQLYGGYNNTPFHFEAWYLPNGFDPNGTGWSLQAVSASDLYPATSTLAIKTNQSTAVGTQWILLKAIATDGQERSYWVALNIKAASGGGAGISDATIRSDCQWIANQYWWMSNRQSDNIQQYYEDSLYVYRKMSWNTYFLVSAEVRHAVRKDNTSERWTAIYVPAWNYWIGWYRVQ